MNNHRDSHILNLAIAVIATVVISFVMSGISYGISLIYNGLILGMSVSYLKQDFGIDIRPPHGFSVKTVLCAVGLALVFVAAVVLFFFVFGNISLSLPNHIYVSQLILFFILQLVIAFSEEALFRFYLYEWLNSFIRDTLRSIMIASLLFSFLHFLTGGMLKQTILSFVFSLYAFAIKQRRFKCPYYLCSLTHFIYNLFVLLTLSI